MTFIYYLLAAILFGMAGGLVPSLIMLVLWEEYRGLVIMLLIACMLAALGGVCLYAA